MEIFNLFAFLFDISYIGRIFYGMKTTIYIAILGCLILTGCSNIRPVLKCANDETEINAHVFYSNPSEVRQIMDRTFELRGPFDISKKYDRNSIVLMDDNMYCTEDGYNWYNLGSVKIIKKNRK